MILTTFRNTAPYKLYFVLITVISNILYTCALPWLIAVDLVEGALVPDAAIAGYSPNQVLVWYDAIGQEGRRAYVLLSIFDLLIIIPSYLFMLSCHLISSKNCPEMLAYLPTVIVIFDVVETLTHSYHSATYNPEKVQKSMLLIAEAATKFKFVFLGLSLAVSTYYLITNSCWTSNRSGGQEEYATSPSSAKKKNS